MLYDQDSHYEKIDQKCASGEHGAKKRIALQVSCHTFISGDGLKKVMVVAWIRREPSIESPGFIILTTIHLDPGTV